MHMFGHVCVCVCVSLSVVCVVCGFVSPVYTHGVGVCVCAHMGGCVFVCLHSCVSLSVCVCVCARV